MILLRKQLESSIADCSLLSTEDVSSVGSSELYANQSVKQASHDSEDEEERAFREKRRRKGKTIKTVSFVDETMLVRVHLICKYRKFNKQVYSFVNRNLTQIKEE